MKPTPEQLAALDMFRSFHGRRWKAVLRDGWEHGIPPDTICGGLLQQLRNEFGPAWLIAYRPGDTKVGYLKPDFLAERCRARRAIINAWRIVGRDGVDLVQPWPNSKNEARTLCRDLHITLIEDQQ